MQYRTKLVGALILVALFSSSAALLFEYKKIKSEVVDDFLSRTQNIATTLSELVDSARVRTFYESFQKNSPEYLSKEKDLRRALNTAHDSGILINSIYTVTPSKEHSKKMIVGFDVTTNLKAPSLMGTLWELNELYDLSSHLDTSYAPHTIVTDHRGIWLSGFAPIKDSAGKYIATIGVTVCSRHLILILQQIIEYQIIGVFLSLIVAILGAYFLSRQMIIPLKALCAGVEEVSTGNFTHRIQIPAHDEFHILASAINKMSKGLSEKSRLKKGFTRYLTHEILSNVIREHAPLKIRGGTKKVTLIFVRFKNFPHIVEQFDPKDFFALFNETYLKFLSIVFRNSGSLEKLFSDQILIEFGIPLDDPDQEENALKTAVQIQEQLNLLNQLWQLDEEKKLEVHIGIHTGEAIVGTIGSTYRKGYTVMGEHVSIVRAVAQRCADEGLPLVMSERTADALKEITTLEPLGSLHPKGRVEKINLFILKDHT